MEMTMRFAGLAEVDAFLARHPGDAGLVRAWLTEMRQGSWPTAQALKVDFDDVDATDPPKVVFVFRKRLVRVETLINFRMGVVLLTRIRQEPALLPRSGERS
jgi:hypothetical protein